MNQQTMMHLGAELVLFCGLFYYTSRTMGELKKEIGELREENQELRDYVDQNRPISGSGITSQQIQQLIQNALQIQSKDLTEIHQSETQQLQEYMHTEHNKWEQREQEYRLQLAQYDQKLQQLEKKLEKKIKSASLPPPAHPIQFQSSLHPPTQQPSHQQSHPQQSSNQSPQQQSSNQSPQQQSSNQSPQQQSSNQSLQQQSSHQSPQQQSSNQSLQMSQPPHQQQPHQQQPHQYQFLSQQVSYHPSSQNSIQLGLSQPAISIPLESMFGLHMGPPQPRTSSIIIEEESDDEKSDSEEIEIELEVDQELEKLQKEVERSISKRKSKSRK